MKQMFDDRAIKGFVYGLILILLAAALPAAAADDVMLGDESDGGRGTAVHLIELLDEEGSEITTDEESAYPFSTVQTCGACHSVDKIEGGWHFNSAEPNIPAGRPGQPWIFVDASIGTQIPLSYRPWPGAFNPQQLGITGWQMTKLFGRQMPSGVAGELAGEENPDEIMRQFVSGTLEINCLSCHNSHVGQDHAEYAAAVDSENFRWAAAAACEFASVTGSAKDMPDTWDPMMGDLIDDPKLRPPTVTYRKEAFDDKGRVLFSIEKKLSNQRCYSCHSNANLDETGEKMWTSDEDVHLAAGLLCVDCHRNGLDHKITRGYEGEVSAEGSAATLTCSGCHINGSDDVPMAGRLGAPEAKHWGIPTLHFEKLTCTACHSGPWPEQELGGVKTSRAHALGTHNVNKSPRALPHLMSPFFKDTGDGVIGPHRMFWPAYWGQLMDGKVTPVALDVVRPVAEGVIVGDVNSVRGGDWYDITPEQIAEILAGLSTEESVAGEAAYIAGGKLYSIDDANNLSGEESEWAGPYAWPMAHDVRPASQSLGIKDCEDCHDSSAAFIFGDVAVDSPVASDRGTVRTMAEFENVSACYNKALAVSFNVRDCFTLVTLCFCAVIAAVLVLYVFKCLACVLKMLAGGD